MMMKRIDPSLNSDQVAILQNTAYKMGAFQSTDPNSLSAIWMPIAPVMAAAKNRIAEDSFEPNNTEAQAKHLVRGMRNSRSIRDSGIITPSP